jgi:uncharacterized protein with HEPN domain
MQRDDLVYAGHMLDTARHVASKVRGKTRRDFDEDEDLRLAVAHLLQIIGEAARRVSREFQRSHPELPWAAIIGMRHKVVHDYLNVDEDVVWDTATQELGPLIDSLEKLVPPGPDG